MPLRKAFPGEEQRLLDFVGRDPYFNLFLISNLKIGLGDLIEAWVQEETGGLLVRRSYYWTVDPGPDPASFDYDAAAAIVNGFGPQMVMGMSGRPEAVDPLYERIQYRGRVYAERFAICEGALNPAAHAAGSPRPANPGDLEALVAIYADAGDMSRSRAGVEQMLPTAWVVEEEGAITCAGNMAARTEQAGMIGAVFTPPPYRRKGYASALVHAMAAALVAEGRTPCLFYVNPDAGRIYRSLGFREIGSWRLIKFGLA